MSDMLDRGNQKRQCGDAPASTSRLDADRDRVARKIPPRARPLHKLSNREWKDNVIFALVMNTEFLHFITVLRRGEGKPATIHPE
jgi:hypothetical protein